MTRFIEGKLHDSKPQYKIWIMIL